MLHLILSRVGGGKTTHVRKMLSDYVKAGLDGMTVIVPEQFSFATERDMLRLLGARNADKVDVLSFSRLSERILDEKGLGGGEKIDESGRVILMSLALERVRDSLTVYGGKKLNSSAVTELLELSAEFKQCAVTPQSLRDTVEPMKDCLLKKKILEIALILESYDSLLSKSYSDERDNLTRLYDVLKGYEYFKNSIVVIDAFKGFTEQEYKIIECILQQAKVVYITLCTDELSPVRDVNGVFTCVRRTAERLMNIAQNNGVKLAKPSRLSGESKYNNFPPHFKRYKSEALAALEAGIYDPSAPAYDKPTDDIVVCEAMNPYDECAFVAHNIKRLLREGYRCREIAVISREEGAYDSALKSALLKCGVPVFEDKRHPVAVQPLMVLVDSALKIASGSFTLDSISRYLKTGLSPLNFEETALLENYALLWEINGRKWVDEWTMHPDGYGEQFDKKDIEKLAEINTLRLRAVTPLMELKEKLSGKDGNGGECTKAVYLFLDGIDVREKLKQLAVFLDENGESALALEQERMWSCLMDILDRLHHILQGEKISAKRFYEFFSLAVSAQTLGSIPQGLDEITIGSAERVRTIAPKAVFIVGANDGVFPRSPITGGMLNDRERKRLRDIGLTIPETGEARALEERFIVYNSVCSASEKLFVTYPVADSSGGSLSPSEIIAQVCRIFPTVPRLTTSAVEPQELIEGDAPAFELLCSSYGDTPLYATLKKYFEGRPDKADKVAAFSRAVSGDGFKLDDKEVAAKLFGKNLYLSASRAESFYRCPFQYFCKYGMLAKKLMPAKFDPMQRGTVIHYVLEKFLRAHPGDGITQLTRDDIKKEILCLLNTYLNERMGGDEKPKRFAYLYARLAETLTDLTEFLSLEFASSLFRPVDFELKIDAYGDIAPYELALPDGGTMKIKGSIDRVDTMELGDKKYIRIIDYKFSGKEFRLGEVLDGLNLQMLIYLFAVWKNGTARYGEVVPSGVLYMAVKSSAENVQMRGDDENLQKKKIKKLKMNGMVLDDALVITGMDKDRTGTFIPVKTDKNGKAVGNLIDLEHLKKLKGRVDKVLSDMAQSLHGGFIPALPACKKGHAVGCDFCDYISVCGHEADSPVRKINEFSHDEAVAALDPEDISESDASNTSNESGNDAITAAQEGADE